jgi:formylmethanofuran dehydrogenase subunit E
MDAYVGSDADPAARISDLENLPFEALSRLHPRLCPRQVLGVRMGHQAGELLNLQVPRIDKRILAISR